MRLTWHVVEYTSGAIVRQVSSRVVYENRWMTVFEDQVSRPDGSLGVYSYVHKPDFVLVVPAESDGFHLVQEYRYPIGRRSWSFPQGFADSDDWEGMARRELAEETGQRATTMRHLGCLHNAHGTTTETLHLFLATGLSPGESAREHTEQDMEHRLVSRTEFEQMVREGAIQDSCSIAAYALLLLTEQ